MSWLLFGFISAVADSIRLSFTKFVEQQLPGKIHPLVISFAHFAYGFPVMLFAGFLFSVTLPSRPILAMIGAAAGAYVAATVLTAKSAKCCELSATIPYLAFAPVFITIFSAVFLHESPTLLALVGILFIVNGGYFIHFDLRDIKQGALLASFSRLKYDKGAQYMLIVAVLFGVIATLNRYIVGEIGPWLFLYWWFAWAVGINFLFILPHLKRAMHELVVFSPYLLPLHCWYIVVIIADTLGLTFAIAPLVFAVKRVEILITVLVGAFVFKEHNIFERLIGVAVMAIGLIMVVVWG